MTKRLKSRHKNARVWNPHAKNWMYPKKLKGSRKGTKRALKELCI